MFGNGSQQNVHSLERTFHRCFLPSFSSFGWGVSEEKIKMWKVNGRQTMDAKWWQKLTLTLARWANKKACKINLRYANFKFMLDFFSLYLTLTSSPLESTIHILLMASSWDSPSSCIARAIRCAIPILALKKISKIVNWWITVLFGY